MDLTSVNVDQASTNGVAPAALPIKFPAGDYFVRVQANGDVDQFAHYTLIMSAKAQVAAMKKLAGLSLTAASDSLSVGQGETLSLAGFYSDASSQPVITGATFVSSDPAVLTVDAAGAVQAIKEGHAMITASWGGKAAGLALTVGVPGGAAKQAHGNLIVVAGGSLTVSDNLKQATLYISELAYQKFQARNFTDEDIFFMSQTAFHDLNGDGYDDQIVDDLTPTKDEVAAAISGWAAAQDSSGPLYLYLADHGAPNQFLVASGQPLTGAVLNAALDSFQKATGRPVVVIIEACYSGSFVPSLTSQSYQRLILTSVDATNPGYLSSDGTTSYSSSLLTGLYKGQSIFDSLNQAKADLTANDLPYKKMAPQMAGPVALQGLKVGGDFVLASIFPELKGLTASQSIDAGATAGTLSLNAQVTSLTGGLKVWAVIVPPDYLPPEVTGDFVSTVDELPRVELIDEDQTTKLMDGLYSGTYEGFTKNGNYTVIFYAKDSDNNLTKSAPVTITVGGGEEVTTTTTTTTSTAAPTTTTTIPSTSTLTISQGWSLLSSTIGFDAAQVLGSQGVTSVWKWQGGKWAVFLQQGLCRP